MSWYALAVAMSVLTLGLLVALLRRGQLREKYAALWIVIGLAIVVVGLAPSVLESLSDVLGVETPSNLLFFLGAMVLLGVCLHLSWECSRLEEETRRLAEEHALLRLDVDQLRTAVRPLLDR